MKMLHYYGKSIKILTIMKIHFDNMKHTLPILCILLLATMTAYANGDPVAVRSVSTTTDVPVNRNPVNTPPLAVRMMLSNPSGVW